MRRFIYAFLFILLVFYVLSIFLSAPTETPNTLIQYYIQNSAHDTFAENCVSAIYLNYRVYDSLFETLILLTSATAVICFSRRHDDE